MVAFVPPSGNEKPLGPWTNTCMSLLPSGTVQFSLSMKVMMGSRTELHFHKETEPLMAETDVS